MEVRHFDCTIAGLGAKRQCAHLLERGKLEKWFSALLWAVLVELSSFPCLKNGSSEFRRKNLPNIQHCHICSDHFEPSCFEGVLATAVDATITWNWTLRLHRFYLYPVSKLCFLYSGDFNGKPSTGEVNRKVIFASNWDTSFREWHSHYKLGFINSTTIKIRKTTNRAYVFTYMLFINRSAHNPRADSDPRWQFVALFFANTRSKS